MADLTALEDMPAGLRAKLEAEAEGRTPPGRSLDTPASLHPRILDGRWKKLQVFLASDFLPAGAYRFEGARLVFSRRTAVQFKMDIVTVIDPLDGERWTYTNGTWERSG